MPITDETFFAWLDGELPAEEADRVAQTVATDPALRRKAEAHRALGARLTDAFAPVMAAPVPDRIAAPPIDFASARRAREERSRRPAGLPQWAAIAASLVVGVALGTFAMPQSGSAPLVADGGQLVAAASLKQALDSQLASAPERGDGPRVALTFRARDGALCRSFTGAAGSSGLACRSGEEWRVRGLFGSAEGQSGEFRMAAGDDPRLAAMIADQISGEPFDAAAEREALERDWR